MDEPSNTAITLIGFGEVGQRFARDFRARERVSLDAFDILVGDPVRWPRLADAAGALGVRTHRSVADAAATAEIVFSAVTADQALAVATDAARYLRPGQIFVDVNSASPATKVRAAAAIEAAGAHYVEAAVMAPVRVPGITVPILAGGPFAADAAARLNALGMNLTPVAVAFGRASATKLCRSIMIKGIEALMVDCAKAVEYYGVADQVYGSLAATFPSIDWPKLATDMGERVATHGVRRAAEMREAADMLAEAGIAPELARAVADAQERGAKKR